MKKILCVFLMLLMVTGCSSEKELQKFSSTFTDIGFDTFVTFTAYASDQASYDAYAESFQKEFKHYHQLFDKYNNYPNINNIKTINDNAGIQPVKVDQELINLIKLSKTYDEVSGDKFDITMGSVLNIWHDYREAGTIANQEKKPSKVPTEKELKQAEKHSGWDQVEINEKESSIYIKDKETSLDVGGVAKGYAVEKIAQSLEKEGLSHAIINAGGNVRLINDKPDGSSWSVGLQIPDIKNLSSDSLLSLKFTSSKAIVTSGDYQRYYLYNDQIMHHIIDPSTLFPARYARSVTVITDDSGIADILSTTLYTMSYQDGISLLKKLEEQEGIQVDAIWVYDEAQPADPGVETMEVQGYQVAMSENLKNNIK